MLHLFDDISRENIRVVEAVKTVCAQRIHDLHSRPHSLSLSFLTFPWIWVRMSLCLFPLPFTAGRKPTGWIHSQEQGDTELNDFRMEMWFKKEIIQINTLGYHSKNFLLESFLYSGYIFQWKWLKLLDFILRSRGRLGSPLGFCRGSYRLMGCVNRTKTFCAIGMLRKIEEGTDFLSWWNISPRKNLYTLDFDQVFQR